ncbi:MAG: hypothetical protein U1F35_17380 [Steroidobacteraceae bacterium]
MSWRQWIGLAPTEAQFGQSLVREARQAGDDSWHFDAAASLLRSGERIVNVANIHREFIRAPRALRAQLRRKYLHLLLGGSSGEVSGLWGLAQTRVFPLLRTRFESTLLDIRHRLSSPPVPPRIARPFASHLELVIGYDHGSTVSQVQAGFLDTWNVGFETLQQHALSNLRALKSPRWLPETSGVWRLDSTDGYQECFLQVPSLFERLEARGTPLAMVPNRGMLLATGSEEAGGIGALLNLARQSLEHAPWPLCGELFEVREGNVAPVNLDGEFAPVLEAIRRIDMAGIYSAQQSFLQAHCDAIHDDVHVADYGLMGQRGAPDHLRSWCTWNEGVPALLPRTDLMALVRRLDAGSGSLFAEWAAVQRIAGHHFQRTQEDPERLRVASFPTPQEWEALEQVAVH